jgi:DNA-binding NarL/FixJ family response regulator
LARELRPDLVIMDVVMPGTDGIAATRQIRAECPATRVIALSMHSDRRFVSEMVRAGALGYLVKDSAFEELNQAVRTVMANRPYLSAVITGTLVEDFVRQTSAAERPPVSPLHMLPPRLGGVRGALDVPRFAFQTLEGRLHRDAAGTDHAQPQIAIAPRAPAQKAGCGCSKCRCI